MAKLEVFEPAMCCPTGVCGVNVDPVLVQFIEHVRGKSAKRSALVAWRREVPVGAAALRDLAAGGGALAAKA